MRAQTPLRPSQLDTYLPFILETLAKFPTLTASRLHAMVRERGYPTLLPDVPAPTLRAYPKATAVAEKLHAVTVLGVTNTRMKDFFDLRVLLHDNRSVHVSTMKLRGHEPPTRAASIQDAAARRLRCVRGEVRRWSWVGRRAWAWARARTSACAAMKQAWQGQR